jgi:hypothetical protein
MVVTRRVVREDATSLESKKGKKLQYNDYARERGMGENEEL